MKKIFIVDSSFGLLAFDEQNNLIDKAFFSKKPEDAIKEIYTLEKGQLSSEVQKLVERLKSSDVLILENESLARSVKEKFGAKVLVEKTSQAGEFFRSNLASMAVQAGFVEKSEDLYEFIRQITTLMTKAKVRVETAKRDRIVIQVVNALDEVDKTLNLLSGRIIEWYGIHFPELSKALDDHETYAKIVSKFGLRENINFEALEDYGLARNKAEKIAELSSSSIGAPMSYEDMQTLQQVSSLYLDIAKTRNELSERVEDLMKKVAPNLEAIAGHTLGARLIALSGGLERLSMFPAGTFQILGAEKALFRSLRTGSRPPKHGVIFQHPLIHQSPRWQRGKMARALAGKLAIATRVDAFSGTDIGEKLKNDLEKRVSEIKEKYKEPPLKQERQPKVKAKRPKH